MDKNKNNSNFQETNNKQNKATIRKTLVDDKGMTYEVVEELDMSVVKIPDTKEAFEKLLPKASKEEK